MFEIVLALGGFLRVSGLAPRIKMAQKLAEFILSLPEGLRQSSPGM